MADGCYPGGELALFAGAHRWKAYCAHRMRPYIRGRVLEVGAGLGSFTRVLHHPGVSEWLCLEPDPELRTQLTANLSGLGLAVTTRGGTLAQPEGHLAGGFDAIVYLDVLEHIEDDRAELARAAGLLAPKGSLLVLAPAWPWLFSPFDAAVGHYRRYTRPALAALTPRGLELVDARYLDAVGMCASLANRLLLHQGEPKPSQIRLWDRFMVPLSRLLDPLLGHSLGRSVLARWVKA